MTPSELGPLISRIERIAEICTIWQSRHKQMTAVYRFGCEPWRVLDASGIAAIRARYVATFSPHYLPYAVFSRACWWLAEQDRRPKLKVNFYRDEREIVLNVKTGEMMSIIHSREPDRYVGGMIGVFETPPGREDGPYYLKRAIYGTGITLNVGGFDTPEETMEYWRTYREKMAAEEKARSSSMSCI